jgi:hypothetical protein
MKFSLPKHQQLFNIIFGIPIELAGVNPMLYDGRTLSILFFNRHNPDLITAVLSVPPKETRYDWFWHKIYKMPDIVTRGWFRYNNISYKYIYGQTFSELDEWLNKKWVTKFKKAEERFNESK